MIRSIYIKNIALIEETELEFQPGLNVLSGETGAGKSIMIDSLTFVLGDRADKGLIRYGQNRAMVQVVFDRPDNAEFHELMEEYGLPDEDEVIIRRTMSENGRSDCRVNGYAVNLSTLRKLVTLLIDVHTQHESTYLLNEANHLKIFDRYIGEGKTKAESYRETFRTYTEIKREIATYRDEESRLRRMDVLQYQIGEIERAAWQDGEEELLKTERSKLQNFQRIQTGLNSAFTLLNGEESFTVGDALNRALKEIRALERYVPEYAALSERLEGLRIDLSDVSDTIESELESGDSDPNRLAEVEKRLEEIRSVKRKYGQTPEEVEKFRQDAQNEYDTLASAQVRLAELDATMQTVREQVLKEADELHALRIKAKEEFSSKIVKNLNELGIPSAAFDVFIDAPEKSEDKLERATESGYDSVIFRFSANKGEPMKPLAKIASGGEMSRFMLGLKNITAEYEQIGTLVFDEIDTGISGKIAHVIAAKLYEIALGRQVIAVTHLPQLAAMADENWRITKTESEQSTYTNVKRLTREERLEELVRLSGSMEGSEIGKKNAEELLGVAERIKEETKRKRVF